MVDRAGARAYVALSALDEVVVVDLRALARGAHDLGRAQRRPGHDAGGARAQPGRARLFVAESGADAIAVIRLPGASTRGPARLDARRPHPGGRGPQVVVTVHRPGRPARRSSCTSPPGASASGPTSTGPVPTDPFDPIFWAFNSLSPRRTDVFSLSSATTYLPAMVDRPGRADAAALGRSRSSELTPAALRQIQPRGRSGGPRRHAAARRRARSSTSSSSCARTAATTRSWAISGAATATPARRVRQEHDPQPARPGHALPAPRPRVRQLGGLDPGALLDRLGERPRLRRPQLGPGVRRARAAQRLRRVRRDLPRQRLPVQPGRAPGHLLLQLRRGHRGDRAERAGPRPLAGACARRRSASRPTPTSAPASRPAAPTPSDLCHRPGIRRRPERTRWTARSSTPASRPAPRRAATPTSTASARGSTSQLATDTVPTFNYLCHDQRPHAWHAARLPRRRAPWWPTATWRSVSWSR